MDKLYVREFWKRYFTATQQALPLWLAHLSVAQRVQMLDDIMQWRHTTSRYSAKHDRHSMYG